MWQNEMLRFGEIYTEKCKSHLMKELTDINGVDIDRILVSNKYTILKYFIGYTNYLMIMT